MSIGSCLLRQSTRSSPVLRRVRLVLTRVSVSRTFSRWFTASVLTGTVLTSATRRAQSWCARHRRTGTSFAHNFRHVLPRVTCVPLNVRATLLIMNTAESVRRNAGTVKTRARSCWPRSRRKSFTCIRTNSLMVFLTGCSIRWGFFLRTGSN
jgi:hypothetical protein